MILRKKWLNFKFEYFYKDNFKYKQLSTRPTFEQEVLIKIKMITMIS